MKVFYFITTVGHGKGGHFHSLNTVANSMTLGHDVHVINIGRNPSTVFENSTFNFTFFPFNGFNLLIVLLKLLTLIKKEKPDVLHAFDLESFFFVRACNLSGKRTQFLNKCGGPNPNGFYPYFSNIILFSLENLNFFKSNKKFENSKFFFIPNRVKPVQIDVQRIEKFHQKYGKTGFDILRISRIGKHYETSITQSLNLLKELKDSNFNARLIVIGTIQDINVFNRLKDYSTSLKIDNYVVFETNELFTHNASELLPLGQLVVGTGRNFMEAASLNLPLMVPSLVGKFPILVDELNFMKVFETNFSPRTKINDFNEKDNLEQVKNLITDDKTIESKKWFEEFFNADQIWSKYTDAYKNASKSNFQIQLSGLFLHAMKCIKPFILK